MSGGMPELGSKISLISKADIRYEGKLFTVDATECTIALSEVRSFGTEDRETRCIVPAQPQIYDYILFRGSDIKDIRVLNTQPLNDPAIVQVSAPPALSQPNYPAIQQHPGFTHSMMAAAPGHSVYQNSYNPMASGMNLGPRQTQNQTSELERSPQPGPPHHPPGPPGPPAHHHHHQQPPPPHPSDNDLIGGSSRSSTPAVGAPSRKSPMLDQSVQVNNQQNRMNKAQPNQHHYSRDNQGFNRGGNNYRDQHRGNLREREFRDNRDRGDFRDNRDRGDFRDNRDRGDFRDNRDRGDYRDYRDRNNYSGGQMLQRMPNAGRGWVQRGGVRPWGNGRGGRPQLYNHPAGPLNANQKPKNKLKFDKEYDFEQANSQFEELRSQLSKIKIDGEAAAVRVNGETDKKDDSGNETGIGEGETESEETESAFYNKSKSFFDNISCEAIERSKGRLQRIDWRQERKLNSETFGMSMPRRGYFRGGRGAYYGGSGYNNNYNRGGYHRQQNYNRPQSNSNRGSLNSEDRTEQKRPATSSAPPQTSTTANTTATSD